MAAFGPDCLALLKLNREISGEDSYPLFSLGANVHFHAARLTVESRFVLELAQVEFALQFAIDAREQIQIEGRGYPQRIVIGPNQLRNRLLQIGP